MPNIEFTVKKCPYTKWQKFPKSGHTGSGVGVGDGAVIARSNHVRMTVGSKPASNAAKKE